MALALIFGFGHVLQIGEKLLGGVDGYQSHALCSLEGVDHFIRLAQAQQTVIHKDAGQLVADGMMHESGSDGGIHPATETAHHPVSPHLLANLGDSFLDEIAGRPVGGQFGYIEQEITQYVHALVRVLHFGMELHRVAAIRDVTHIAMVSPAGMARMAEHQPAGRNPIHVIAVAHPHVQVLGQAIDQRSISL